MAGQFVVAAHEREPAFCSEDNVNAQDETEDERYRRISSRFAASYMSDAKWRRLFTTLARAKLSIQAAGLRSVVARWKFIDSDRDFPWGLPDESELGESHLRDGWFQGVGYRWIESIFIPRQFQYRPSEPFIERQDVDNAVEVLRSAGQFMLEESPEGVTIRAYAVLPGGPEKSGRRCR